ncbi:MAG: hypothetical protein KFKLKKLM_00210 [Flavobacteriales bacterium]|nr:hypothetical protein [Flavobacteriales bacterium]
MSITEDKSGNLWFGTDGGGVNKYNGHTFETFTTAQGLANNGVRSITEDKSGNLWFGTNGGGVSKYNGHTFETFTTAQGLANNVVFSITEDKSGNLWFGTEAGVAFLPESSSLTTATNPSTSLRTRLHPKALKSNSATQQVTHRQGFITIGTSNGLPDDFITQVLQGADGKIYVGTNYGIASFDVPTKAEISEYLVGLHPNSETRNFKLNNLEIYNSATHYPVKDVNVGQNGMYQDSKGIIWAGTGSDKTALVRFNPKTVNKPLTPPTTVIKSIKVLGENVCWYNIKSEVGRPKPEEKPLRNSADSSVFSAVNSLSQDSMAMLLAQFHAFGKPVTQDTLNSQYTKFKGIRFDGITNWYPLPQNLELPHQFNSISFDYVANELSRNHLIRYQYLLEGQDENWSPITAKNDVSYTNLFEGNYTFKIKAQYTGPGNNEWSELTTYSFKVLPPWYRTWWAYTIYVILTVCVIWLIVWWNGRKLRARAEQLKEEVNKATAEIATQKKQLEEKHEEIIASIRYAKRIQDALLASQTYIERSINRLKGNNN